MRYIDLDKINKEYANIRRNQFINGLNNYNKHYMEATATSTLMRVLSDSFSKELISSSGESLIDIEKRALQKNSGKCFYTGEDLIKFKIKSGQASDIYIEYNGSADHIIPTSIGGLFVDGNIVMTTEDINKRRGNDNPVEFHKILYKTGISKISPEEFQKNLKDILQEYILNYKEFYQFSMNIVKGNKNIKVLEDFIELMNQNKYKNLSIIKDPNIKKKSWEDFSDLF